MRVIDTSVWIEWLIGSPLGKKLSREIPNRAECIVPTIVQLELAKWLTREVGEEQADQMIAFTQKCLIVPLDTRIALLAADLHRQYALATATCSVAACRWRSTPPGNNEGQRGAGFVGSSVIFLHY